jgi:hypothetical protein
LKGRKRLLPLWRSKEKLSKKLKIKELEELTKRDGESKMK